VVRGTIPAQKKTAVRKTSPNSAFLLKNITTKCFNGNFFNWLLPSNLFGIGSSNSIFKVEERAYKELILKKLKSIRLPKIFQILTSTKINTYPVFFGARGVLTVSVQSSIPVNNRTNY
jgi:hypothetical protein